MNTGFVLRVKTLDTSAASQVLRKKKTKILFSDFSFSTLKPLIFVAVGIVGNDKWLLSSVTVASTTTPQTVPYTRNHLRHLA
jgi:hypothetical protein